jgi:uncharacterized OsmC-like protein
MGDAGTAVRRYEARAESTPVFGRVLCSCRTHHFVSDGPLQNGCPGEEVTPGELFLAGVASCGVELLQVLARQGQVPLTRVSVTIQGVVDREKPVRSDVTVFNAVRLHFAVQGVSDAQAAALLQGFKAR